GRRGGPTGRRTHRDDEPAQRPADPGPADGRHRCGARARADGIAAVLEVLGGPADAALECVGTEESFDQCLGVLRPGGRLGYVGVPATSPTLPLDRLFGQNISVAGGMAPVRPYIDELLPDVLTGKLFPGLVFDRAVPLTEVDRAYSMMDQRKSIKTMLTH